MSFFKNPPIVMRIKIIYHAVFTTEDSKHDRWASFARRPSLGHFWDWVHGEAEKIKEDREINGHPSSGVVIVYANRIKP